MLADVRRLPVDANAETLRIWYALLCREVAVAVVAAAVAILDIP